MNLPGLEGLSPGEIGERLAAARRARSLSQADVARHLGLSRPTLVAMEKGTRAPKPHESMWSAAKRSLWIRDAQVAPAARSSAAPAIM